MHLEQKIGEKGAGTQVLKFPQLLTTYIFFDSSTFQYLLNIHPRQETREAPGEICDSLSDAELQVASQLTAVCQKAQVFSLTV